MASSRRGAHGLFAMVAAAQSFIAQSLTALRHSATFMRSRADHPAPTSRHSSKAKSKHQDSKHYVGSSRTGFRHLSKIASASADTSRFKRSVSPIPEN